MSHSVCSEALKYGDFEKGVLMRSLQDYRNKSRMGKDHYDRDSVIHDIYYSLLLASEACGSDWTELEQIYRDVVTRIVEHAERTMDPSLGDNVEQRKSKAAKTLFRFMSEIKTLAQECQVERERAVKSAEETMKLEEERLKKTNAGLPFP